MKRSRRGGSRDAALFAALALLAILLGPASAARPLEEDAGVGGDYSDDFAAAPDSAAAAVAAEGAEGGANANAAAIAALAARTRGDDNMRASEVGFAGVRFGGEGANAPLTDLAATPLMRACASERAEHCARVRTHKHDGRLFRCLAARAGGVSFSDRCRVALAARVHARQSNWRLDPRLVRECGDDAAKFCPREDARELKDEQRDAAAEEEAAAGGSVKAPTSSGTKSSDVLRCLARHSSSSGVAAAGVLSSRCEAELSRASHAFLFLWAPSGPLTQPCDRDVGRLCLVADELLAQTPGAVDACLEGVYRRQWRPEDEQQGTGAHLSRRDDRRLAPTCASLMRLSSQGRERALKREFSASLALYAAVHTSLGALEKKTGHTLALRDAGGEKIIGLTPEGVGAAVGGSIGGLVLLGLVVGGSCWWCAVARKRRQQRGLMAGAGIGPPKVGGGGGGAGAAGQKVAAVFLQMAPKV
jgi:hypothetical protein